MAHQIKTLSAIDLVSDERRTWYVVEWMDSHDKGWNSVHHSADERTEALSVIPTNAKEVIQYEILSPIHQSMEDIESYIMAGNSRLTF